MPIDSIDWSKLKPYQNDKRKSFEELCYQVAQSKYADLGSFTSIDDSGGGDGVEFYLTLSNGDQWGWQAKFYFPDERLNPNRRQKVRKSLELSRKNHSHLRKWFLCTPTNLSPSGKCSEVDWFKTTLQTIAGKVKLVHWGDSEFVSFLAEPSLIGKKLFFFGDLELSNEWFKTQVNKQLSNVGNKFIEELHSSTARDYELHCTVGDRAFIDILKASKSRLENFAKTIERETRNNLVPINTDSEWKETANQLATSATVVRGVLKDAIEAVNLNVCAIENARFKAVREITLSSKKEAFHAACDAYYKTCTIAEQKASSARTPAGEPQAHEVELIRRQIRGFESVISCSDDALTEFYRLVEAIKVFARGYTHILSDAGFGKTHLMCHTAISRIEQGLPTILLLGEQFGKGKTIENHILEICDIPANYSWSHFVAALASCAQAYRTRAVILIDGLNETVPIGIWASELPGFMSMLSTSDNIALITTCRSSYRKQIWYSHDSGCTYLHGFDGRALREVVDKYFKYFKIKADLTFESIKQFHNLLYLRIFCEAVNPEREAAKKRS